MNLEKRREKREERREKREERKEKREKRNVCHSVPTFWERNLIKKTYKKSILLT